MTVKIGQVETRFYELRYEGDNVLSGTAMVYGDTAELPWGERERFDPGAFGAVNDLDLILNAQHDRSAGIARTDGGGLTVLDTTGALTLRAELDMEDPDAFKTMRKVKKRILRGLSVEFIPDKYRREGDVLIHERATLRGIGVVDRPAYPQSVLREKQRAFEDLKRGDRMPLTPEEIKELREMMQETVGALEIPTAESIREAVKEDFTAQLDTFKTEIREELAPAESTDDAETDDSDDDGSRAERMGNHGGKKKKRKDAEEGDDDEEDMSQEDIDLMIRERSDLIVQVRSLLPEDFDSAGQDRHAILVAAVGDEIENANDRSEDYLMAKVEDILERRKNAHEQRFNYNANTNNATNASGSGLVEVHSVFMERRRKEAVQTAANG